ncbi:T9SS type A sorting domain-containing protein [bacterium]|nr:T9SS type A sorting domain-containing protein [bacterium]
MNKIMLVLAVSVICGAWALNADTGSGESASGFLTSMTPEKPVLDRPANHLIDVSLNPLLLTWHPVPYAATYTLQVSRTPGFKEFVAYETGLTDTAFALTGHRWDTTYYWRVQASNAAGAGPYSIMRTFTTAEPLAINENDALPERFSLMPVYPNPFNPQVMVTFQLPQTADLTLSVVNSMGQTVCTLASGSFEAGTFTIPWDGNDSGGAHAPSGMYFCRLEADAHVLTQKMLLMR